MIQPPTWPSLRNRGGSYFLPGWMSGALERGAIRSASGPRLVVTRKQTCRLCRSIAAATSRCGPGQCETTHPELLRRCGIYQRVARGASWEFVNLRPGDARSVHQAGPKPSRCGGTADRSVDGPEARRFAPSAKLVRPRRRRERQSRLGFRDRTVVCAGSTRVSGADRGCGRPRHVQATITRIPASALPPGGPAGRSSFLRQRRRARRRRHRPSWSGTRS